MAVSKWRTESTEEYAGRINKIKQAQAVIEQWEEELYSWLESNDWNPQRLIAWLEDDELVHDKIFMPELYDPNKEQFQSDRNEPFDMIGEAIGGGSSRQAYISFFIRVAAILADWPDVRRPGKNPDKVLYNLLNLCIMRPYSRLFADLLSDMHSRNQLSGNYRGVDLRKVYMQAQIKNQSEQSWQSSWEQMIYEGQDKMFPDDPETVRKFGFQGLLEMPDSRINPDNKAAALARAIQFLLQHEPDKDLSHIWSWRNIDDVAMTSTRFCRKLYAEAEKLSWPIAAIKYLERQVKLEEQGESESSDHSYHGSTT